MIEEKNKEILDLTAQVAKLKIEKKTAVEEERNRCFHEVEEMKQELKIKDYELKKANIEIEVLGSFVYLFDRVIKRK